MGGFVDIAATIKQPESPISQLSGALALKSQVQQQQMGQVQLEQAQQEQRSSATLMRIFAQNNGDMNQTLADARASGQVIPSHLLDFQTKSIAAQVQASLLSKEQLANHKAMAEQAANELDSIKSLPPDQAVQGVKDSVGRLLQSGGPDTAKWLLPVAQDLVNNPTPE